MEKIFNPLDLLPRLPLGDGVDTFIDWLLFWIRGITRFISDVLSTFMDYFADALLWIPPFILVLIFALLAYYFTKNYKVALFSFIGLALLYNMELWSASITTITMILISVLIAIVIGVPLGILASKSDLFHQIITPVLDFMQTLPPFVYLIPAVFFFGTGVVAAMIATVVFAMPPVIRLTNLGIRLVNPELIEAAAAFGTTYWQKLSKIQVPLAMPTIMAGVNQCIMLALSMVVIAAMIGGGGLGALVLRGINRLDIGLGFESGLGVVIVAIILDRITQSSGQQEKEES